MWIYYIYYSCYSYDVRLTHTGGRGHVELQQKHGQRRIYATYNKYYYSYNIMINLILKLILKIKLKIKKDLMIIN